MFRVDSGVQVYGSLLFVVCLVVPVAGQDHDHTKMAAATGSGWQFMQDGVVYALFNHQSGPRGDQEGIVPNWWMGMWDRQAGGHRLGFTAMFSLDRATVGESGYAKLFQVGETLNGQPLIDRQHPHDFFMQLAGRWRIPLGGTAGLTIAGGPAAEPALGPVTFMHRASALENPTAPLGHHVFDSTHISYGVVTAGVDRGPWVFEGSLFNGREPDENRWDFDLAALDSVSGRVRFQPADGWKVQVSTGFLKHPEELEPGDVVRTTGSISWFRGKDTRSTALTIGYGANRRDDGVQSSFFTEGTWRLQESWLYGRFEAHEPEIALLLGEETDAANLQGTLLALTVGAVRELFQHRGVALGVGGDVSFYGVPEALKTGGYGSHPTSFHLFLRLGVGRGG